MTEEFLWYVWKFRLFDHTDLQTTRGEPVRILKTGEHNLDSGPDFFNARIGISDTEWAGNVEVHALASDWHRHRHDADKAYDNIILHVVHEADTRLFRRNGEEIPTLELQGRIPESIYGRYLQFKSSADWIPCEKQIGTVDEFSLRNWLDRLLAERLERKSLAVAASLAQNKNDWNEAFYQALARNFGQKINSEPFELLAKALPLSVLSKHKNSLLQIEALLFGTAGLLEANFKDRYPESLKKEFRFLQHKFDLKPIDGSLWKFMRLHPPSFPTLRISQFAGLIFKSSHLFSKILESVSLSQTMDQFRAESSEYWRTHYRFDALANTSRETNKQIGQETINNIIINTVVPFLFIYEKEKGAEEYFTRALEFLESLEPENNSIINKWKSLGIVAKNAYETQALLQLKNEYCSNKRCLECAIGARLLSLPATVESSRIFS